MSLIFFPAGKMCKSVITHMGILPDLIIDSRTREQINGITVYGTEKLSELTEKDTIYITSLKYQQEIFDTIRKNNQTVNIKMCDDWQLPYIESRLKQKEFYKSAGEKEIESWITNALNSEVPFWDNKIKNLNDDCRLYQREFAYPNDSAIEFGKNDTILDVGCGALPKFGNLYKGG